MDNERTITTRELLRNYSEIKNNLLNKQVKIYYVNLPDGNRLKISLDSNKKTAGQMIKALKKLPPVKIKRHPEIWDEILNRKI